MYDYAVVGGGIVGLASAWALSERHPRSRIVLLEKESGWAKHQTGRNSGVIHSGIYYKPGSLKARMCRDGNSRLVSFCEAHGIRFEICGKVIVATDRAEIPRLDTLFERGRANGLAVRRLDPDGVRELEPHVSAIDGIHVPSTGIVDYVGVSRRLAELVSAHGGDLRLNAEVTGVRARSDSVVIESAAGAVEARWLVNCAGLHSDRVARLAGARPDARIVPFRGEYYELRPERRSLIRNLVYPVPDPAFPFLGVHFTRMIDGAVHAGPNAVLSLKREGYHRTAFDLRDASETLRYSGFWKLASRHAAMGIDEIRRSFSKRRFVDSLRRLVPEVVADDLIPSGAGVRAQAVRADGGLVDDFLIVPGARAIHVCNAPSPAATACLEIGAEIARQAPA